MNVQVYKTSRKAVINLGSKKYRRNVYEYIDPKTKWWVDCVRIGSMSGDSRLQRDFTPLDCFEDVVVTETATGMPGQWMPR